MNSEKDAELELRYFGSWQSYTVPFTPSEPILPEEAVRREAYYLAYYREGKLVRLEKISAGQTEWTDEYVYWANGKIRERRMYVADGALTVQQFDRRGCIVE